MRVSISIQKHMKQKQLKNLIIKNLNYKTPYFESIPKFFFKFLIFLKKSMLREWKTNPSNYNLVLN